MRIVTVIPARFASTRFPGKPFVNLIGKPMIIWVAEQCEKAVGKSNVYVATENKIIEKEVKRFGFNVIFTSKKALTGTDRVAEVSKVINADIYVNVQGDEPMVSYKDIEIIIKKKYQNMNKVINGYCYLNNTEDPNNLNIPKVVTNEENKLLYMSRSPIPGNKSGNFNNEYIKKQVCIYAFTKEELSKFSSLGRKSNIELKEDIEILRFFDLNIDVLMTKTSGGSLAVDTEDDVEAVVNAMKNKFYVP